MAILLNFRILMDFYGFENLFVFCSAGKLILDLRDTLVSILYHKFGLFIDSNFVISQLWSFQIVNIYSEPKEAVYLPR